jgi:hypothetical protein
MMTPATGPAGNFHAVRFYDSAESLCRIVAGFLTEAFTASEPALVIATPEHRAGIAAALRRYGFDADALQASGDLLVLDAEETLARFMVEGMPDAARFEAVGAETIDRACRGRTNCTIRAYGEMVDVLWKQGHAVAAIRLEMFWNRLAASKDFSLLCGYAMGNFYKGSQLRDICQHHTHVVGDDGLLLPAPPTVN